MAFKTNKSYSKRLKITRKGKILGRKAGQNHFNAKKSRSKQLNSKKLKSFQMDRKDIGIYLAHK